MGLIATCGLALLTIFGAACARLIADELKEWTPRFSEYLIRMAVRGLPEGQRQRYEEEWRGHLRDVPGQIAKIYVASGFLRASRAIARIASRRGQLLKVSGANYVLATEQCMIVRDDGHLLQGGSITWTDCDATVTCGSCSVLIEEHETNPVWRGEPCPDCGSRDRIFERIREEFPAESTLRKIARRAVDHLRLLK